jgi:hypothetical protein
VQRASLRRLAPLTMLAAWLADKSEPEKSFSAELLERTLTILEGMTDYSSRGGGEEPRTEDENLLVHACTYGSLTSFVLTHLSHQCSLFYSTNRHPSISSLVWFVSMFVAVVVARARAKSVKQDLFQSHA